MASKQLSETGSQISKKQFADWLNLTTRQISNLMNEGLPTHAEGTRVMIPWPEGLHWYLRKKAGEGNAAVQARQQMDVRMREVELQLAEINLAKELEQVVTLDYMETELANILERLRAKLLNIPGKYAPQLVGLRTIPESQSHLESIVHEAMISLMDTGEDLELEE